MELTKTLEAIPMKTARVETMDEFRRRGGQITICKPYMPIQRPRKLSTYEAKLQMAIKLLLAGHIVDAVNLIR